MNIPREIQILEENLGFTRDSTDKIFLFVKILLECNKKYNLISKNTEVDVWSRHVLDSAQIVKFIDFKDLENPIFPIEEGKESDPVEYLDLKIDN